MDRRQFLKFGLISPVLSLPGCSEQLENNTPELNFLQPKRIDCGKMGKIDLGSNYRPSSPMRNDVRHHKDGVFTHLNLKVVNINQKCKPIAYADVEIWLADTRGRYSDVDEITGEPSNGANYCRGYQTTTHKGEVQFMIEIPAWSLENKTAKLLSRVSHVNFKVSLNNKTLLTTECFFPNEVIERIYGFEPYKLIPHKSIVINNSSKKVIERPLGNESDPFWQTDLANRNVIDMQPTTQGYRADLIIGVSL